MNFQMTNFTLHQDFEIQSFYIVSNNLILSINKLTYPALNTSMYPNFTLYIFFFLLVKHEAFQHTSTREQVMRDKLPLLRRTLSVVSRTLKVTSCFLLKLFQCPDTQHSKCFCTVPRNTRGKICLELEGLLAVMAMRTLQIMMMFM